MFTGRARHLLAGAAAAVALAGCGGDGEGERAPNIVQPGAPGEPSRTLSLEELESMESPGHTPADVRFMQRMIHHHAQAVRMSRLAPTRGVGRDVRLLARRIELTQEGEIELMRQWLEERGEPAPTVHLNHGHAHGVGADSRMPGMLTPAQLRRLAAARGRAFELSFLRSMIFHHEGALTMVRQLYDQGGGYESTIDAFARQVFVDQEIEIDRMRALLARLERERS